MIEFKAITKQYENKIALKELDLTILDGEIFGLIGHNGAGKSTTLKTLVSVIEATSGVIEFDGKNLIQNRLECKKQLHYIPDSPDMFLALSPYEYWQMIGTIYEVKKDDIEKGINTYSKLFQLSENHFSPIEDLSHGMRQKTFIIGALIANPKYWVLDEPMTGLDPQASFELKRLMKEHVKNGNTVLFSTHMLEVAENLCDRIAILDKGQLAFVGTMDELRKNYQHDSLETIYLNLVSHDRSNLMHEEGEKS